MSITTETMIETETTITIEDGYGLDALPVGALLALTSERSTDTLVAKLGEDRYSWTWDPKGEWAYGTELVAGWLRNEGPAVLVNPKILGDFIGAGDIVRLTQNVECYDLFVGEHYVVDRVRKFPWQSTSTHDLVIEGSRETYYLGFGEVALVAAHVPEPLADWEKELLDLFEVNRLADSLPVILDMQALDDLPDGSVVLINLDGENPRVKWRGEFYRQNWFATDGRQVRETDDLLWKIDAGQPVFVAWVPGAPNA